MKKLVCTITIICVILSLAGCSLLHYASMKVEDTLKLPDDEMITALLLHFGAEDFNSLNEAQKVVYTAAALEMEVLNGGMVQFLSNEGLYAAPYACEALKKIGAVEHLTLLQDTLKKNNVDLSDLSAFVTDDVEEFSALYDQYDFDSFDNEYVNLPSIPEYIRTYIETHVEDF